jgi:hypothetical protein
VEAAVKRHKQTESLGSMGPVMRLRGGASKKRKRRAYFRRSSSQLMDEMTVEVEPESEKEENKEESQTEGTEQNADTTRELTAEAIAILNEDSTVPATTTTPPAKEWIQIEYATRTDKWHMEDTPGVHMYGGTDITKAESMSKSAEVLTRGIYRSANTIAPVMVEDTNARGHKMPSSIVQNRP